MNNLINDTVGEEHFQEQAVVPINQKVFLFKIDIF